MNNIEAKCQELEDNYAKWKLHINKVALDRFKEGVEMARKDFLDWLIELKQNQSFGNYVIEVARKIEEIKKSLANGVNKSFGVFPMEYYEKEKKQHEN